MQLFSLVLRPGKPTKLYVTYHSVYSRNDLIHLIKHERNLSSEPLLYRLHTANAIRVEYCNLLLALLIVVLHSHHYSA